MRTTTIFPLQILAVLCLLTASVLSTRSLKFNRVTELSARDSTHQETPQSYFGEDFPTSCTSDCTALMNDVNLETEVIPTATTTTSASDLLVCGNCIIAAGNISSSAYSAVEYIQVVYPLACNSTISFTGVDRPSLTSVSLGIFSQDSSTTALGASVTSSPATKTNQISVITSKTSVGSSSTNTAKATVGATAETKQSGAKRVHVGVISVLLSSLVSALSTF
ncbi:hypothetical protein T439DRAFT_359941 [Meredithblackwellia eburnea MCA 4105]